MKATDDPATIGKVDMVIFSVKLRDAESAAKQILPLIGPGTGIISSQNGVTKDDTLAPIVGRRHLLGGAACIAVSIARPGVIKKAGTNERLAFGGAAVDMIFRVRLTRPDGQTTTVSVSPTSSDDTYDLRRARSGALRRQGHC